MNLNIDASEEEALFRVIDETEATKTDEAPARSLAVNSEEQLLWLVTGGKLQKRSLDVFSQKINTLWPKPGQTSGIEGIPVQEGQVSADGKTLYLMLMSADGRDYKLSAVDAQQGKTHWSHTLGHSVWNRPLLQRDHVLMVDIAARCGESEFQPARLRLIASRRPFRRT